MSPLNAACTVQSLSRAVAVDGCLTTLCSMMIESDFHFLAQAERSSLLCFGVLLFCGTGKGNPFAGASWVYGYVEGKRSGQRGFFPTNFTGLCY